MNLQEYLEKKTEVQTSLLDFLDNEEISEDNFENIINLFEDQKIQEDKQEFISILRLIKKVSKNHHRSSSFFPKIERIFKYLKDLMNQNLNNFEIFNFFKGNKRILLFLIQEKIITLDQSIVDVMTNEKYSKMNYSSYFYPEIQNFLDKSKKEEIEREGFLDNLEIFEENRKIAENDKFICKLIRNDNIDDFISHVNRINYPLMSEIQPSIFETNSFLLKNTSSLIEYSAFFGSIQIMKFLFLNKVKLTPSLWIYSIHGRNPDMIHFLEDNQIKPNDASYKECLNESLKCHHLEITEYIRNNLYSNQNDKEFYVFSKSYKFCNYSYFPKDLKNEFVFYDLCQYNYIKLVEFLVNTSNIDMNFKIILKKIFIFK